MVFLISCKNMFSSVVLRLPSSILSLSKHGFTWFWLYNFWIHILSRLDDAIEILEYVVGIREEKLGTAHPDVDDEKRRLAELLKEAGRVSNRKAKSLVTLLDTNSQIPKTKPTRYDWWWCWCVQPCKLGHLKKWVVRLDFFRGHCYSFGSHYNFFFSTMIVLFVLPF